MLNDPPLIDLNGPGAAGVDNVATYIEGQGALTIVAADAIIGDADDSIFYGALIELIAQPDGEEEFINVTVPEGIDIV
jgi:hypothetical protein